MAKRPLARHGAGAVTVLPGGRMAYWRMAYWRCAMRQMTSVLLTLSGCAMALSLIVALHAEPVEVTTWDKNAAAIAMDGRLDWWMSWPSAARDHDTFCVSCNTALPYALARPALRAASHEGDASATETRLMDNVVKRVRLWRDVAPFYPDQRNGLPKTSESRGTESILNAVILASRDAEHGALSDDARTAFVNLWALQMRTGELAGAWAWLNFRYEPWEASDSPYYGAALAALAVGMAPGAYASSPDVQGNVQLLRGYLATGFEQQPLLNRMMLLWASTKLTGLLTPDRRDVIVADLRRKQHDDGGWATSSLGTWQRVDGTALETDSDGYATGLATLVLQQAGLPSTQPMTQQGLQWLRRQQDKDTGRWSASSLNKKRDPASDAGQFMNDAATAYAVLALAASH
jgi:squalene-hopene/tetraprenyl-beta-curcumene cyclase